MVKDGERDGKWVWYPDNGEVKEKNYKEGKKDGKFVWFYENEKIKEEENYKDGERVN